MKHLPWLFIVAALFVVPMILRGGPDIYGSPSMDILIGIGIAVIGGLLICGLVVAWCNVQGFIVQSESKRKNK